MKKWLIACAVIALLYGAAISAPWPANGDYVGGLWTGSEAQSLRELCRLKSIAYAQTDTEVTLLQKLVDYEAAGGGGGSGSMTSVKENNVAVGGADIVTLDFLGADFDLTESPDTEIQVVIAAAIARDAELHTEAHTVASHSDTTATGAETDTLTDGSNADSLHVHAVDASFKAVIIETPTGADAFLLWKAPYDLTVTDIDCIIGGTTNAVVDINECTSAGASCASVDAAITCDADGAADDGSFSNGTIDAGDWMSIDIDSISDTPDYVSVTITYTVD